jgi:AcrR family transcriptional regulator
MPPVSSPSRPGPRGASRPARSPRRPVAKPEGSFHHGDLEWAILEAASQLLERDGPAGVSLRAAARLAGVSHNAPYRHFESRESILAALAARGFVELGDRMAAAARGHRETRQALTAIAETYVAMAAGRPHLFRLMFGQEVADKQRHPAVREAGLRAFQVLLDTIVEGQRAGAVRAGDPSALALGHWAVVHGVASLYMDGLLADRAEERGGPSGLARLVSEQIRIGLDPRRGT